MILFNSSSMLLTRASQTRKRRKVSLEPPVFSTYNTVNKLYRYSMHLPMKPHTKKSLFISILEKNKLEQNIIAYSISVLLSFSNLNSLLVLFESLNSERNLIRPIVLGLRKH
jgi:hypothetical protein